MTFRCLITHCPVFNLILPFFLATPFSCIPQEAWVAGASIGESPAADFIIGESVMEYTSGIAIGFLPALYYSYLSSERQLTDTANIQVHFDNSLQRATVFISSNMLSHHPQYYIYGINGILYLHGHITDMPYYIDYSNLPANAYILRIAGLPERIPFVTRWIKK